MGQLVIFFRLCYYFSIVFINPHLQITKMIYFTVYTSDSQLMCHNERFSVQQKILENKIMSFLRKKLLAAREGGGIREQITLS